MLVVVRMSALLQLSCQQLRYILQLFVFWPKKVIILIQTCLKETYKICKGKSFFEIFLNENHLKRRDCFIGIAFKPHFRKCP
jgi:hypothetical protein